MEVTAWDQPGFMWLCTLDKSFFIINWGAWGYRENVQYSSEFRFDVIITCLLRFVFCVHGIIYPNYSWKYRCWDPHHPLKPGDAYRQTFTITSTISSTLVRNKIIDHWDVVGASPVGAAPTTSSFSIWLQWFEHRQLQDETKIISVLGFGVPYIRGFYGIYISELSYHWFKYWLVEQLVQVSSGLSPEPMPLA